MHTEKGDYDYQQHTGTIATPVPAAGTQVIYVSSSPVPPQPYAPQQQQYAQQQYVQQPGPVMANNVYGDAPARIPKPRFQWLDSICDWPKNLYPSCWCACCVCWGMYIQAQMAQKVGLMNFWSVISLTCIIWFIAFILYIIFPLSGVMWWMMGIFSLIFGITLRLTIAQRDAINTPGGCFTELCIGLWCAPCSIAQMARHVYGYRSVMDGDGDPYRQDIYLAHQV